MTSRGTLFVLVALVGSAVFVATAIWPAGPSGTTSGTMVGVQNGTPHSPATAMPVEFSVKDIENAASARSDIKYPSSDVASNRQSKEFTPLSGNQFGLQIDRALTTGDPELAMAAVNTINLCRDWGDLKEVMYARRAADGAVTADAISYMEEQARACQSITQEHKNKARVLASKALLGGVKWSAATFYQYRKEDVSQAEIDAARIGIVRDVLACSRVAPGMAVAWSELGLSAADKEKFRIVARAIREYQPRYSPHERELLDKGTKISVGIVSDAERVEAEAAARQIVEGCTPVYNGSAAP